MSASPASKGAAAPKRFFRGTHRFRPPEQTLEHVRRFFPVIGITRVSNITGLDVVGIPVVSVCRPNSRSLAVSQGKGVDVPAAKVSGIMESIEAYHAERITLPLKLASYEELRFTHRVVDVTSLPLIRGSRFNRNLPLLWIEGYDLLDNQHVWVPYEIVHLNYTVPLPTGSWCFLATSNGLAAGNHLLEAISHAICEVVERDASALWTLLDKRSQSAARIDPSTVDDPICVQALERYERASVDVAIWEITTDIGIPSFRVMIMGQDHRPLYPAKGYGTHLTRNVALYRALTEAAQSRLTYIAGSRDDLTRPMYERLHDPNFVAEQRSAMEVHGPLRSFQTVVTEEHDTFDDDLARELEGIKSAGLRSVIVIDLTKPEFGLPVARVVIPGLEGPHTMRDYLPGTRARSFLESHR